jgi:hypothetical protein
LLTSQSQKRPAPTEVIWRDLVPAEHSVQIYADRQLFIDALEGFVGGGLRAGESVIVIATAVHRRALQGRLRMRGFDVAQARLDDSYIPVDAEAALSQFMMNGWPDEDRFIRLVNDLMTRARGSGRRVRAFGEMVAILWSQGQPAATVQLEHMWNRFIDNEALALFCAYPRSVFSQGPNGAIEEICSQHTRVIPE